MSEPRIDFYISELELEIVKEKMIEHGYDVTGEKIFEKNLESYLGKVVFLAMQKVDFVSCNETKCKVEKLRFKKKIGKKKLNYIQCVATKKNTTITNVVSSLLLKSYPVVK